MIRFLRGILEDKQPDRIEIDVNGVGYGVAVTASTYSQLPNAGERVKIYTHLQVREDGQALYGFFSAEERDLFETLLTVTGVGPKMAMGILSAIAPAEFCRAVATEQAALLAKLPGVGKKTAQRLILELKDKIGSFAGEAPALVLPAKPSGKREEVVSALVALGYSAAEAEKAAGFTENAGGDLTVEEWLKKALRVLAR